METAIRFFHTLKATAGSIGSKHIHKSSETIEKMLSNSGKEHLEPFIAQLKDDLKVLLSQIVIVLEDYTTEDVGKSAKIDFIDLLDQLRAPLQNRKPADIETVFSKINLDDFPKDKKEILIAIHNHCNKYRYKDALTLVEKYI
jgi:HPt (histidine-containing phosphotransfer) domain-containing protein